MLVSGGARGADTIFQQCAESYGHMIKIINGKNKKYTAAEIREYDSILLSINHKYLNRVYPTNDTYVNTLLRRNIEISLEVEVIYAIGFLEYKDSKVSICGGTAWCCYSFIDKYYNFLSKTYVNFDRSIPLYFYNQKPCEYDNRVVIKSGWHIISLNNFDSNFKIESNYIGEDIKLNKDNKIYAGIGSREITQNGITAIKSLYT